MLDADLDIRQDLGELYKYFDLMNRYSARFNSKTIPANVAHLLVVKKSDRFKPRLNTGS